MDLSQHPYVLAGIYSEAPPAVRFVVGLALMVGCGYLVWILRFRK